MLAPPRVRPALIGEDRMVREGAIERSDNRFFGLPVGLSTEIDRVGLAGDLDPAQASQMDTDGRTSGVERHLLGAWWTLERVSCASRMDIIDRDVAIRRRARWRGRILTDARPVSSP